MQNRAARAVTGNLVYSYQTASEGVQVAECAPTCVLPHCHASLQSYAVRQAWKLEEEVQHIIPTEPGKLLEEVLGMGKNMMQLVGWATTASSTGEH